MAQIRTVVWKNLKFFIAILNVWFLSADRRSLIGNCSRWKVLWYIFMIFRGKYCLTFSVDHLPAEGSLKMVSKRSKILKGCLLQNLCEVLKSDILKCLKVHFLVKIYLTLCMLGNLSCCCCCLLTFFKINFFQKKISGTLSECQMVCIQIRTDILSVLIWVQTVCKGYQQTTKVTASKERVKFHIPSELFVEYIFILDKFSYLLSCTFQDFIPIEGKRFIYCQY